MRRNLISEGRYTLRYNWFDRTFNKFDRFPLSTFSEYLKSLNSYVIKHRARL